MKKIHAASIASEIAIIVERHLESLARNGVDSGAIGSAMADVARDAIASIARLEALSEDRSESASAKPTLWDEWRLFGVEYHPNGAVTVTPYGKPANQQSSN